MEKSPSLPLTPLEQITQKIENLAENIYLEVEFEGKNFIVVRGNTLIKLHAQLAMYKRFNFPRELYLALQEAKTTGVAKLLVPTQGGRGLNANKRALKAIIFEKNIFIQRFPEKSSTTS